mmetsp:Transcript_73906/g.199190  ORF Transcript_73906/g.199190 Transcript_73906/m.199190 type:complete len:95 (-) Transcript_73906:24-308(-)
MFAKHVRNFPIHDLTSVFLPLPLPPRPEMEGPRLLEEEEEEEEKEEPALVLPLLDLVAVELLLSARRNWCARNSEDTGGETTARSGRLSKVPLL